jgi:hypothetical protein
MIGFAQETDDNEKCEAAAGSGDFGNITMVNINFCVEGK